MSAKKSAKAAAGKARKETQTLKETFGVKGMHCKSCVKMIEESVSGLPGVRSVSVSLLDSTATVAYDSSKINMNKITKEITSLGYRIEGSDEDDSSPSSASARTKRDTTLMQGIGYALLPHTGCIAFIAASILGVTLLTEFFRPLLMNKWFFHILIAISIGFATLSSALYLRKQGLLSAAGARRKWQYLSTMYGSTIGVNLILFLLVFPMLANVSAAQVTTAGASGVQGAAAAAGDSTLQMAVDIPCPGHASLITGELKTLAGVQSVVFSFPNVFDVTYDSAKVAKADMLALAVFKEYPATVLSEGKSEGVAASGALTQAAANTATGTTGGSCGGSCGGCGGGATAGTTGTAAVPSCHAGATAGTGVAAPTGSTAGTCGGSTGGSCGCGGRAAQPAV
jgi:copper chaperone CopZ